MQIKLIHTRSSLLEKKRTGIAALLQESLIYFGDLIEAGQAAPLKLKGFAKHTNSRNLKPTGLTA